MEELVEFCNQARAEVAAKVEKPAEISYRSHPKDLVPRDKPIREPRYSHYTPLNTSRSAGLDQGLASEVLAVPKRVATPPRADTSKSCKYHRNRGHSTEQCAALKDKIEDLIKQGQLQHFVKRPRSPRYDDPQKRHLRAVLTVHAVERTRQRLPAITFTEANFKGIDPDQDDPMVISVEIHNCIVRKTLVDQGSSADIFYWNTFKQLGIPEAKLIPYSEPLVGFSGELVQTKGYIKLSTRFCFDGAEARDIPVKYVVVHANTSYNILL
uniref:Uncharacterized protein n=1 Tax=Cajanus cajan TaxID=3821 RepID=A0A151RAW6_CAJCA|nr:hypothetical protein KK1_039044 [Cajanus cajan]